MPALFQEIRYAIRSLLKSPVLAAAAVLSLGLGIGANTAIFSLTDQIILRSLPVKHPEELVLFSAPGPRSGMIETNYGDEVSFSYPMYSDFRDRAPGLAGVLARFPARLSMSWGKETELVQGDLVTGNYFSILGASTILGRPITAEDERVGHSNHVVVLSHAFWQNQFGSSAAVLNQSVQLNGQPMTIVGVAQPGFRGVGSGEAPAVFLPATLVPKLIPDFDVLGQRRAYWLNIFARLASGVSRRQAEVTLNGFWHPILEQEARNMTTASQRTRERFLARHLSLLAGGQGISSLRDQAQGPLLVLMGMVAVLLLIASVNVANLLIARAAGRQKEIAIRLAIGAGRGRLIRQLLVEGLSLSVAGGALGVAIAAWTIGLLLSYLPEGPNVGGITAQLDLRVLGFGLALSIATGIFFGLVPALETFRTDVASSLKDQANSTTGNALHVRFRKVLVVAQVGLSLLLLIGAGLFGRSLMNLKQLSPGFRTDHLISFAVQPSLNGYSQPRIRSLYERLSRDIDGASQVHSVALAEIALMSGNNEMTGFSVPGYQPKENESNGLNINWVGPGYLAAMGVPLLRGRDFTVQDGPDATKVAVVNEMFAQKYFEGQDAIGRRFRTSRSKKDDAGIEIVGVAKNGKYIDLREKDQPFAFFPYRQHDSTLPMTFYVRTAQDPASVGSLIRNAVRAADPNLPVFAMKTVEQQIAEDIYTERLVAMLSLMFGVLATLLAAIGLYGVMAYTVSRRTREIGLRMALGAARPEVLRMVMSEVGFLVVVGVTIAIPPALALSRLIQTQLYEVKGADPLVFFGAAVALALVAALAGFVPALRATRIDPITALRNE